MRVCKYIFLIVIFIIIFYETSDATEHYPNPYDIEKLRFNLIPSFNLNTSSNEVINAESLYGKNVIINFWATWSPVSKTDLLRLYENIKDREIYLLAICIDRDSEKCKDVIKGLKARNVVFAYDKDGEIAKKEFKVFMVPTSLYVNRKGIIEKIYFGIQDWSRIIK